jgi:hypothetical protein
MGNLKKDFKYKVIKNFLTLEESNLLRDYCIIKHTHNHTNFDTRQNNNADTFIYADPLMESLMVNKLPLMNKETGLELFPTYSFWRMYSFNADLKKHKDRPACEVSVTVCIGSDGTPWPIYMDGTPIDLKAGDAAIYLGCEVEHWREEFTGDWAAQCFLHYIDSKGPYTEHKLDKRPAFGFVK